MLLSLSSQSEGETIGCGYGPAVVVDWRGRTGLTGLYCCWDAAFVWGSVVLKTTQITSQDYRVCVNFQCSEVKVSRFKKWTSSATEWCTLCPPSQTDQTAESLKALWCLMLRPCTHNIGCAAIGCAYGNCLMSWVHEVPRTVCRRLCVGRYESASDSSGL